MQSADGGYLLGGYTSTGINGDKTQNSRGYDDYWIIKLDSTGQKEWDKRFGGNEEDYMLCACQTSDGGFLLGGESRSIFYGDHTSGGYGLQDYWIVKIDSLGNKQWDKDFGGPSIDRVLSVQQTIDSGYILAGQETGQMSNMQSNNYWIIKTNANGIKQWEYTYGGDGDDFGTVIRQTPDGGYIVGGYSDSPVGGNKTIPPVGANSHDYWVLKVDAVGGIIWQKVFGGTDREDLNTLELTSDGGYILGGRSFSGVGGDKTQPVWGVAGDFDYWVVKIDSLGNKIWDKDFGGASADEVNSIIPIGDGGFLISGYSWSDSSGNKTENNMVTGSPQEWLVRIDSAGSILWDKTIFTDGGDKPGLAVQTKDGCFALANYDQSGIGGYKSQANWSISPDYWIIKFCDSTTVTNTSSIFSEENKLMIYPNPVIDKIMFSNTSLIENPIITIYNTLGAIVQSKIISPESEMSMDISALPPGIYMLQATTARKVLQAKVVKE